VPDIPTYDPWSVTPQSRFTEGPTYVEVDHPDDEPEHLLTEHQTGYAPPPPAPDPTPDAEPATEPPADEPPPTWPS
jgi:hypothetical protein